MGKSRLLWEFSKYIDGLERLVLWHQGRSLSYGEGVAFWALAEMIRSRIGIVEEEDAGPGEKFHGRGPRARGRRARAPAGRTRLALLLGLEGRAAPDRADLFSGWRLFLERLAAQHPWCSSSRTFNGPTPACWTSSTTCWSGRPTSRSSSSRLGARSRPRRGPTGPRWPSSRCRATRCSSSWPASSPGSQTISPAGSSSARREFRSTQWRR